jgi:hypothetical protein
LKFMIQTNSKLSRVSSGTLDIVCNLWQIVQTPFWTTKGYCQDSRHFTM